MHDDASENMENLGKIAIFPQKRNECSSGAAGKGRWNARPRNENSRLSPNVREKPAARFSTAGERVCPCVLIPGGAGDQEAGRTLSGV